MTENRLTTEELIQRALKTNLSNTEHHYAVTALASAMNDIANALNKLIQLEKYPPIMVPREYKE